MLRERSIRPDSSVFFHMTTYAYNGYDKDGKKQKGLIEASDRKQACEKLAAQGVLPREITPAAQEAGARFFSRNAFGRARRTLFYSELSSLLRAGLPLSAALEVLLRSHDLAATRGIIAGIRDKIREGAPLAEAIRLSAREMHPAETAFITAGEKSGQLEGTLGSLAAFMGEEIKLRERLITALIYPAIIVAVAAAIAVGLLGFALPRLTRLMGDQSREVLPFITRFMLAAGDFCAQWWPAFIALAAAAAFGFRQFLARRAENRVALDRKLFALPVAGRCYAALVAMRFARTLAILLRGGAPLVESIALAGQATGSRAIMAQAEREAEAVKNGSSLSQAVGRMHPLGEMLSGIIEIGENTGALDQVLQGAGERYHSVWEQQLARVMAWLEPALILGVGLFVLLVVIAILLPILNLNRMLQ